MSTETQNFFDSLISDLQQFYDESLAPIELFDSERYTDEEFIAEGAIKSVSRIRDNYCNRVVAIARIREDVFDKGSALDFVREVQLTASLEHPNIVRIYDVGIDGDQPYFTMELTTGETLDQWMKNNTDCSLFRRLDMFRELCDAVDYAHKRDILHLDIKPSNVQCGESGRLTLMDWGISYYNQQHTDADLLNPKTLHGYIKGTPGFMAPEQAEPDYVKREETDVFGLGATLYFMLSGEPPYDGEHLSVVLSKARLGKLKRPKNIPEPLFDVLKKALMPVAVHRYSSVADLRSDVENYQSGFATSIESASAMTQAKLFVKRNIVICTVMLWMIALLIGLTFFYIGKLQQREEEATRAKVVAEEGRADVEDALSELEAERQSGDELRRNMSYFLVGHTRTRLDDFNFEAALEAARASLESNPDSSESKFHLALVYIIRQEFAEAFELLQFMDDPKSQDLRDMAAKYRWRKNKLSVEETLEAYKAFNPDRKRVKSYFFIRNSQIKSASEHAELVKIVLKEVNQLKTINFYYDWKTKALDLSGNANLRVLEVKASQETARYNILSTLPLKKLKLKGSKVTEAQTKELMAQSKVKIYWK